jgi:hypothetical protein
MAERVVSFHPGFTVISKEEALKIFFGFACVRAYGLFAGVGLWGCFLLIFDRCSLIVDRLLLIVDC